jgi:hypothetical protein
MRAERRSIGPKPVTLLILLLAAPGSAVRAQTPEDGTPTLAAALMPGMAVWITDSGGREVKSRIVDVSGDTVTTIAGSSVSRLSTNEVVRVRVRDSDSVINGALIGAGAAVASGLLLCSLTEPWENCRDDVGPMLRIGALGAGMGIAIDAWIRGRKTIYDAAHASTRLHAAPIVARGVRGVQISLTF